MLVTSDIDDHLDEHYNIVPGGWMGRAGRLMMVLVGQ